VSQWGEGRPTFDADNFRIDIAAESKAVSDAEESDDVFDDDTASNLQHVNSPESLSLHYRYEYVLGPSLVLMVTLPTIAK
jgi:hypothetical protein